MSFQLNEYLPKQIHHYTCKWSIYTYTYYMHISQEHFFSFKIELPTPTKYQQHFIYNYMYVYSPYFLLEHCNKFGFFGGVQRTQIDFSSESNFQMYQFSLNLEFFRNTNLWFFLGQFQKIHVMGICAIKDCVRREMAVH